MIAEIKRWYSSQAQPLEEKKNSKNYEQLNIIIGVALFFRCCWFYVIYFKTKICNSRKFLNIRIVILPQVQDGSTV